MTPNKNPTRYQGSVEAEPNIMSGDYCGIATPYMPDCAYRHRVRA